MCPKGDDPLTLDQEPYFFTVLISSDEDLSGTLGIHFQGGVSNFQLDGPTSRQCKAALEASGNFKSVECTFMEISSKMYSYNISEVVWPISPKENNLYSHSGNPSSSDFHCDGSLVAGWVSCHFTTPSESDAIIGKKLYVLFSFAIMLLNIRISMFYRIRLLLESRPL